jgi:hypothetical protein
MTYKERPPGSDSGGPEVSHRAAGSTAVMVADARDRRRARTVRRMASIELTGLLYGAVPAARWCTWCHGRCRVAA